MSCFDVSKFTGKCTAGKIADSTNLTDSNQENSYKLLRKAANQLRSSVGANGVLQSKKKSKNLPEIEIIQELAHPAPPSSPRPYCSVSPLPPGTPVGPSSRRFECPSACSIQPSPSPHLNHQQQSTHTSKFVTPGYVIGTNFFNSSIPPSPSMSVGCRSPIIPRKSNYTTLEVQSAAMSSLRDEVLELTLRLSHVSRERDHLEKSMTKMQVERLGAAKKKEAEMDNLTTRYEERIIELHSVIAELSRQVEEKSRRKIVEENSDDELEERQTKTDFVQADQEGLGVQSDVCSRTSTDINAMAVEAGNKYIAQMEMSQDQEEDGNFFRLTRSSNLRYKFHNADHLSSNNSLQVLALQEELIDTKERNVQLGMRLQQRETDLEEARRDLELMAQEKDILREKVTQLEELSLLSPAISPTKLNVDMPSPLDEEGFNRSLFNVSSGQQAQRSPLPKMRMAEKKRIHRIKLDIPKGEGPQQVTGSDLLSTGVRSSFLVEHLVQDIQDKSSMQELSHSFMIPALSISQANISNEKSEDCAKRKSEFLEGKLKEFEIEMERLGSRIEHLKSQNELLTLSLSESRNHCDNITVLIGKYESNFVAQQLSLTYANHIIDSLESLVALLESELTILAANTHVEQFDLTEPRPEILEKASLGCHAANLRIKDVLEKLENFTQVEFGRVSSSNQAEGCYTSGIRPWEDSAWHSQNTSSASPSSSSSGAGELDTSLNSSFVFTSRDQQSARKSGSIEREEGAVTKSCKSDKSRLLEYIRYLKATKLSIQSTLVSDLETVHSISEVGDVSIAKKLISMKEARTADIEMAVLVQELMAMREERADLRSQVYVLEQEKRSLELFISSQKAQETALKAHIKHLQEEMENQESMDGIESDVSFRSPNNELKSRIAELLTQLEKVKRNSELRQQKSEELIQELKNSQRTLSEKLNRTKRRYETRLKHMEQQILQSMLFPFQFQAAGGSQSISDGIHDSHVLGDLENSSEDTEEEVEASH